MAYWVAQWNAFMKGRDGKTPYFRRHGVEAPYVMYPWGALVLVHLHKDARLDEETSDRWKSKLTPCAILEVMGQEAYGGMAMVTFRCADLPPRRDLQ